MMYVIIIGSVVAILWILTDGLRGEMKNNTNNDKFSQFDSQKSKDEGTHLGKAHTFLPRIFKSRH